MTINQVQKKAVVEWLNNPITKQYYNYNKEYLKNLKENLLNLSLFSFEGNGITNRSKNEINLHTRIIAFEIVMANLSPLFEFQDICNNLNWEIEEIAENYDMLNSLGEKETHENPLNNFINQIYKNDRK